MSVSKSNITPGPNPHAEVRVESPYVVSYNEWFWLQSSPSVNVAVDDVRLRHLLFEAGGAEGEQEQAHAGEYHHVQAKIVQIGAAQHNRPFKLDVIGGGEERTNGIKNPRHGFAGENEPGKEHRGQNEDHGHLQRLNLILCLGRDQQPETEQRKNVKERGKHQTGYITRNRHLEQIAHHREKAGGHQHSDAKIR